MRYELGVEVEVGLRIVYPLENRSLNVIKLEVTREVAELLHYPLDNKIAVVVSVDSDREFATAVYKHDDLFYVLKVS